MKYFLIMLLMFAACQSKKEETSPSIKGEWEYKTIELFSGEKFDLQDSGYNVLHLHHVGLTLAFTGKKTFTVTQKRPGSPAEVMGSQDYEVEGDSILRLINTGRPDDRFPIVSLSDSLLKLNLFN